MSKREINLLGGYYKDSALPWSAQDTVNWLPVASDAGGTRSPMKLRGAPGLRTLDGEVTPFTDGQIFLLHYNGANDSTAFPDSGNLGVVWTRTQDNEGSSGVLPVVSTAQSKFGGSSGFFQHSTSVAGRGGFLLSQSLNFINAENWTYETFFYNTGGSIDNARPIGFFTGGSFTGIQLTAGAGTTLQFSVGEVIFASPPVAANQWVHVAFQRRNTTSYDLFINGALIGTYTSSYNFGLIGTAAVGLRLRGYLDETRFTLNRARYPLTGFTPPTAPFPPA